MSYCWSHGLMLEVGSGSLYPLFLISGACPTVRVLFRNLKLQNPKSGRWMTFKIIVETKNAPHGRKIRSLWAHYLILSGFTQNHCGLVLFRRNLLNVSVDELLLVRGVNIVDGIRFLALFVSSSLYQATVHPCGFFSET